MRRQAVIALLLCLLLAMALTACKGEGGEAENNVTAYDTYDAWIEALGYTPNTPASLPGNDFNETYAVEAGDIAKATYSSPDQVIIYRTAQGEDRELISFDDYPEEIGVSTCKGFDIPLYGDGGAAHVAQWSEGGKTFAVFFKEGVTVELFDEFIMYI